MINLSFCVFKIFDSWKLFCIILCIFCGFIAIHFQFNQQNEILIILHLIIGLLSILTICISQFGLLAKTIGIYSLVAYCFFPLLELFTNTIYWGGTPLAFSSKVQTNIVIIIFLILFILSYRIKLNLISHAFRLIENKKPGSSQRLLCYVIFFLLLFLILSLYEWKYGSFFFRGGEFYSNLNVELKSSFLIVEFFLRPLIFNFGLYIFWFSGSRRITGYIFLVFGIFSCFPTAIPRFLATSLYLPFILNWAFNQSNYYQSNSGRLRYFLPNILLMGLICIFPFLDVFRWFSASLENQFDILRLDTMLAGHFDSYQMLVRALDVGEITYGIGFLGALFFFVPRSLWSTKPNVSGLEVAQQSNLYFDNVSLPLIGEFYLNFWFFGIFFCTILFGIIVGRLDSIFLSKKNYILSISWVVYFQTIGCLLLILRGGLISAFAYFVALILTWVTIILVIELTNFKIKLN